MKKGSKHTRESINKISNSKKGSIPWNLGLTKYTDKRVADYSEKLIGRTISEETRKKMSKIRMGQSEEVRSNIGRIGGLASMSKRTKEEKSILGRKAAFAFIESVPYEKRLIMYKANVQHMIEKNKRLSPERRSEIARIGNLASRKSLCKRPNKQELRLEKMLNQFGFKYNYRHAFFVEGYSKILKRIRMMFPDFIHESLPILIENDGWIGHSQNSPFADPKQKELDDERDDLYRIKGYEVVRVIEKEHQFSDEKLLDEVLWKIHKLKI